MRTVIVTILSALGLLTLAAAPARADLGVSVVFSEEEVRIIAAWYREHGEAGRGHGGGKNKGLPPGIVKNLARGKSLPPGIAKQALPSGLIAALPAPPRGYERVVIDGRVLLVEIATRMIHDVLTDVILR